MKFKDFLKDKVLTISLIIFAVITIEIFLSIYNLEYFIRLYVPIIILSLYCFGICIEYFVKKKFYQNLFSMLNELDEKYLVSEIVKTPSFSEGKILKSILEDTGKSMLENVNKYKYLTEDYKEYIELWIHEIKTPIAASKLIIENNKNDITKSINKELVSIENYIEQALFYARSNTVEKDYYITANNLEDIINESIKKNKTILIQQKININMHDVEKEVHTDSKWVVFILNQIIQNSAKYMKDVGKREIEIYSKQGIENVILYIKDNGIGIKKEELRRVFEKGFTGTNGRVQNKKSTGIGLYLCKKLCHKLGIGIELKSTLNKETKVSLTFPKSSYIQIK